MIPEGEDGVTHINVYSKGKTGLGKQLSNFSASRFKIDDMYFNSVEGYWYFIKTGDIRLQNLAGYKAKELGKSLPLLEIQLPLTDFEAKIKEALDLKIKSDSAWLYELAKSSLPLVHYYEYGGKRVDAGYEWIIEHLELRREQLKTFYGFKL